MASIAFFHARKYIKEHTDSTLCPLAGKEYLFFLQAQTQSAIFLIDHATLS